MSRIYSIINRQPTYGQEKKMFNHKYTLIVNNGEYHAHSLLGLYYAVISHRMHHFLRGEGWID